MAVSAASVVPEWPLIGFPPTYLELLCGIEMEDKCWWIERGM